MRYLVIKIDRAGNEYKMARFGHLTDAKEFAAKEEKQSDVLHVRILDTKLKTTYDSTVGDK